jgi:hypothetical protein
MGCLRQWHADLLRTLFSARSAVYMQRRSYFIREDCTVYRDAPTSHPALFFIYTCFVSTIIRHIIC